VILDGPFSDGLSAYFDIVQVGHVALLLGSESDSLGILDFQDFFGQH
jgi:hypothetical protein